jgi:nucleotide sugar dehydrogenase
LPYLILEEKEKNTLKLPLKERIHAKKDVRVAVIGVGYVGLPMAVRLAEVGFGVVGVEVSPTVVKKLKAGNSTVEGITNDRLQRVIGKALKLVVINRKKPETTSRRKLDHLVGVDVFLICVPTPLNKEKEWTPDTSYIEDAGTLIRRVCEIEKEANALPSERLIVLESTTYPGTTRSVFSSVLSQFATKGKKWYLAYSPERTNPAPDAYDNKLKVEQVRTAGEQQIPGAFQITRIIGGNGKSSRDVAKLFYETVFDEVRAVRDLETAEMIKLVENTFRFTSIAFANEIARVCKTIGLNVWEIIDAARGKGFGFELCYPGLVGGHCLPIDPHYLNWAIRNRRLAATFVDVAESEHQNMRREAFDLILRVLNQQNKGTSGASILFLGVSYKKNVGDIRESAAIKLMEKLYASGAELTFWDPVRARHPAKPPVRLVFTREERKALPKKIAARLKWDSVKSRYYFPPKEISGEWSTLRSGVFTSKFSCVVLATDHDDFRVAYKDLILAKGSPPIADLSNAINRWLGETKPGIHLEKQIENKLKERTKYMLLGLH